MGKPGLAGARNPHEPRKHLLRSVFSLMLSLVLATSMLPVAAFADDNVAHSSARAGSALAGEDVSSAAPADESASDEGASDDSVSQGSSSSDLVSRDLGDNSEAAGSDEADQSAVSASDKAALPECASDSAESASNESDNAESASDSGDKAVLEAGSAASDDQGVDSKEAAGAESADTESASTGASDETPSGVVVLAAVSTDSGTVVAPALFTSDSSLPQVFDLRNVNGKNYVTSVKQQAPWGDCWAFAAIAAAETSILYELGISNDNGDAIDLSELHLAWFAATPINDNLDGQLGEGVTWLGDNPFERLDAGGWPEYLSTLFASGIGPIDEAYAPYGNVEGYVYVDVDGNPICFRPDGDWSVPEELRYCAAFELQGSSSLPTPTSFVEDDQGNVVYQFNQKGLDAFKEELTNGRPISISFYADNSQPGQADPAEYISLDTYAHYTYEFRYANHAVTIVGYDDNYSASNFAHDGAPLPPGDGAFIVKNSWGSVNGDFPNAGDWGEEGTGYFYLSYYDQSITTAQTYNFFTAVDADDPNYLSPNELFYAHQYSYMPVSEYRNLSLFTSDVTKYANVFNATDERLRTVACETTYDDAEVTYQVYLLNDNATDPEDGQLLSTVTEAYAYAGFHRAAIPDGIYLKDGQRFSVVVTQKQGDQYVASDRVCLQSFEELEALSIVGIVNPGESFFYSLADLVEDEASSSWIDYTIRVADLIAAYQEECPGFQASVDNPAIRAYGDPISYLIDVVGKLEEDAMAQLKDAGYAPEKAGEVYSNRYGAGTVVQTVPSAGSYLIPGSLVQYLVSLGAEPEPAVTVDNRKPASGVTVINKESLHAGSAASQESVSAIDAASLQQGACASAENDASAKTLPATSDSAADATAALLMVALVSLCVAAVARRNAEE